jgi:hypothetical protein
LSFQWILQASRRYRRASVPKTWRPHLVSEKCLSDSGPNYFALVDKYFGKLVTRIFDFDGDIQKFVGDAFFAEWRVTSTRSLVDCATLAAMSTCMLAKELKDYPVEVTMGGTVEIVKMNCHFGLGIGDMLPWTKKEKHSQKRFASCRNGGHSYRGQ